MEKIAKNMDTVFADSKDALDLFDIMFDDDDTIIDTVNGIDHNGVPKTGPDPEDLYKSQGKESDDDILDKNDTEQRAGKEVEKSKNVEGEDQESIQAATESDMSDVELDSTVANGVAADPLAEDDPAERAGAQVPRGNLQTEATDDTDDDDISYADSDDEYADDEDEDAEIDDLIGEADELIDLAAGNKSANDPIDDPCDAGQRAGAVKVDDSNVEGEDQEQIDNVSESDDIVDPDDAAQREGEVKPDTDNVDGESQERIDDVNESDIFGLAIGESDDIVDPDDAAQRSGKEKPDDDNVEGEDQESTQAATEAAGNYFDKKGKFIGLQLDLDSMMKDSNRMLGIDECGEQCECGGAGCEKCTGDKLEGNLDKDIDEQLSDDTVPDSINTNEADDPLADLDDADQREGEETPDDDNVEGEDQELIDKVDESNLLDLAFGEETEEPLEDLSDPEQRSGEETPDDDNVEGEDQESIQAATESDIDSLLYEAEGDEADEATDDDEAIEAIENEDDKKASLDLEYEDGDDDELINIAMGEGEE